MMTTYRTIVVGTDGSALAEPTVRRAARLAQLEDADLVIVCAWSGLLPRAEAKSTLTLGLDPAAGDVRGRSSASQALADAVGVAREVGATTSAALLVEGDPAQALMSTAEDRHADLIVVGAIRDVSIAERLLGTVATDVVRGARCDVLVVRPTDAQLQGDQVVPEDVAL